jgi:hypothetical protein
VNLIEKSPGHRAEKVDVVDHDYELAAAALDGPNQTAGIEFLRDVGPKNFAPLGSESSGGAHQSRACPGACRSMNDDASSALIERKISFKVASDGSTRRDICPRWPCTE